MRRSAFFFFVAVTVVWPYTALAADGTWKASGGGAWFDPTNWVGGVPDGAGEVATFGPLVPQATAGITLDSPVTLAQLQIENLNSLTLDGGSGLTFDGGSPRLLQVTAASGDAEHRLLVPIALPQTLTIDHGGSGNLRLGGPLSGSGDLIKTGTGQLVLDRPTTGDSSGWSGNFFVNEGTVVIGGNGNIFALGDTTGTTFVADGATLNLGGYGIASGDLGEDFTIAGFGQDGQGALQYSRGYPTVLLGQIELADDAAIQSNNNPIGTLHIGDPNGVVVAGGLTGAGRLVKMGGLREFRPGILQINVQATHTGGTEVREGILLISDHGSLVGTGDVTVGVHGQLHVTRSAGSIAATNSVDTGSVLLNDGLLVLRGALDPEGFIAPGSAGSIAFDSEYEHDLNLSKIFPDASGSVGIAAWGNSRSFAGALRFDAGSPVRIVRLGQGDSDFTLSSPLLAANNIMGVDIRGNNEVTLSGASDYQGVTTVKAVLNVDHASALGAGGGMITNGTVIDAGAVVRLNAASTEVEHFTLNGGELVVNAERPLDHIDVKAPSLLRMNARPFSQPFQFHQNADAPLTLTGGGIFAAGISLTATSTDKTLYLGGENEPGRLTIDPLPVDNHIDRIRVMDGVTVEAHLGSEYHGRTVVEDGTLRVEGELSLGSSTGVSDGTEVQAQGALLLFGGTMTGEHVLLRGGVLGGSGGTFANQISLIETSTLNGNDFVGTITGSSDLRIAAINSKPVRLRSPNTYQGQTHILNGTTELHDPHGLGSAGEATTVHRGELHLHVDTHEPILLGAEGELHFAIDDYTGPLTVMGEGILETVRDELGEYYSPNLHTPIVLADGMAIVRTRNWSLRNPSQITLLGGTTGHGVLQLNGRANINSNLGHTGRTLVCEANFNASQDMDSELSTMWDGRLYLYADLTAASFSLTGPDSLVKAWNPGLKLISDTGRIGVGGGVTIDGDFAFTSDFELRFGSAYFANTGANNPAKFHWDEGVLYAAGPYALGSPDVPTEVTLGAQLGIAGVVRETVILPDDVGVVAPPSLTVGGGDPSRRLEGHLVLGPTGSRIQFATLAGPVTGGAMVVDGGSVIISGDSRPTFGGWLELRNSWFTIRGNASMADAAIQEARLYNSELSIDLPRPERGTPTPGPVIDRLEDDTPIYLYGSKLFIDNDSSVSVRETVGPVHLASGKNVIGTNHYNSTLVLSSLQRSQSTTVEMHGSVETIQPVALDKGGIIGGWAEWNAHFVTYGPDGFARFVPQQMDLTTASPDDVVLVTQNTALAADTTVHALNIESGIIDLNEHTLKLDSGGIIIGEPNELGGSARFEAGILTAGAGGPAELIFHGYLANVRNYADIEDNTGGAVDLVISGPRIRQYGQLNHTGRTVIHEGRLYLDGDHDYAIFDLSLSKSGMVNHSGNGKLEIDGIISILGQGAIGSASSDSWIDATVVPLAAGSTLNLWGIFEQPSAPVNIGVRTSSNTSLAVEWDYGDLAHVMMSGKARQFSGGGLLEVQHLTVTDGASIEPGDSAGTLTLRGDLLIGVGGILSSEIVRADEADRLDVVGDAEISGELHVSLLDGYTPTSADRFVILSAESISGQFSNVVDGRVSFGAESFKVEYEPHMVVLSGYIPEPSCLLLFAVAGASVLCQRRRCVA